MYAGGGNADERVSGLHLRAVNELCFIRHADAEARKVIFLFGIKAGHLRRFAADQRAPRLHTALSHARHDLLHALGHIFAHRNIVQKNSGFAPAQATSFAHMATQSMPTVSCLSIIKASFSLVPTPSVPETSTGSFMSVRSG